MTDPLFEAGKFLLIDVELFDEHIEITALVAEIHTDAGGVIDDNEGQDGRERESASVKSLIISDGGEERYDEGGMGARHVAVREDVFRLPTVLQGVENEFDDLGDDADANRNDEYEIGLYGIHIIKMI